MPFIDQREKYTVLDWQRRAFDAEQENRRLLAEVETWKERCEAINRDFEKTIKTPCPNCGETY